MEDQRYEKTLFSSLMILNTPKSRNYLSSTAARRSIGFSDKTRKDLNLSGTPVHAGRFDESFNDSLPGTKVDTPRASFRSETTRNLSGYGSPLNYSNMSTSDPTIDVTVTTAMILSDEDPSLNAVKQLYQEFRDLYVEYSGEHEIFDLLLRYEESCSQTIHYLTRIVRKAGPVQQKFLKTSKILNELIAERDTWRLLHVLFKDRLESINVDEGEALMNTLGKRISDKDLVENLYSRNPYVRQCQLIVDWLEKNAADCFDEDHFEKMEHFSDQGVAWEHTLHTLLTNESDMMHPSKNLLITEMDPDAPLRQKDCTLSDIDKESDFRLLKYMFLYLRTGHLDQAQILAQKYGQPWLAAALDGWRLHHDPNYNNNTNVEGEVLNPIEGNQYRDIWKKACWAMADDGSIPLYEKAMFAALSGNIRALLPACLNWEDHLWAHFRVMVDQHIEEELHANTQQERCLVDLPDMYSEKILDLKQVFQELKASESQVIREEGKLYFHVVQQFIILDDISGLIEQLDSWLRDKSTVGGNMMRFMTHLIYFLRVIGRSCNEDSCIAILESYVEELIKHRHISLVAAYVATLPSAMQIKWYARFLEGVTENSERQQCLKYAEDAGLDIREITKTVVVNVRGKDSSLIEDNSALTIDTAQEDKLKIDALDWLVYDPIQRAEAIKQANALMRVFVASRKLDAAKLVFAKIPSDSLAVVMEQWKRRTGRQEFCAEDDNAAREYLCFKAYLDAHEAFNDWFNHFQHAKPVPPAPPMGEHVRFKEKVAHEHQMKEYESELERWENVLFAQTKTTTDRLYNMLLFVGGGWMVDQRDEENVDEGRQQQMSLLRKLCIPQIAFLLRNVFYHTGQHKECIQLADIVAADKHMLYKEFSVEEIRKFLDVVCESSYVLLDSNLDALGYQL